MRIGIIGTGIMGRGHAEVLAAHPDAEITAVCRKPLAGAPVFPTYQALIESGLVDAVSITTPDHLHADVMVAAARAGLHILVEKPFTTTVEDADRAVQAIRQAGVTAMCLFNHRWVPAYAQAKDQMPVIGEPVVGYARKDDTIYVPTEMISWADQTTCAWFLSSHDIDLLTWLYDDHVVEVYATARYGKLKVTPDA
ncbi:Gfo/Idh/MocA family protein, partial [Nonomuraea sp. NPDC004297]